jgi:hypothetical protein
MLAARVVAGAAMPFERMLVGRNRPLAITLSLSLYASHEIMPVDLSQSPDL